MTIALIVVTAGLFIWCYLLCFHGGFWRYPALRSRTDHRLPSLPEVAVVLVARNHVDRIAAALRSLLGQRYDGRFCIVVLDVQSSDETANIARQTALGDTHDVPVAVVGASPAPPGWTGQAWALQEGVNAVAGICPSADYLLFTDADVVHAPSGLARLVGKAEADRCDLVSALIFPELRGFWAKLLLPFAMFGLRRRHSPSRVNRSGNPSAMASDGAVLVRRESLMDAAGVPAIKAARPLFPALARLIKSRVGRRPSRIWWGYTATAARQRPIAGFSVSLGWILKTFPAPKTEAGSKIALACAWRLFVYGSPVFGIAWGLISGDRLALELAAVAWAVAGVAFIPTLWRFRLSLIRAPLVPLVGAVEVLLLVAAATSRRTVEPQLEYDHLISGANAAQG